jgi:hypothetical protein
MGDVWLFADSFIWELWGKEDDDDPVIERDDIPFLSTLPILESELELELEEDEDETKEEEDSGALFMLSPGLLLELILFLFFCHAQINENS